MLWQSLGFVQSPVSTVCISHNHPSQAEELFDPLAGLSAGLVPRDQDTPGAICASRSLAERKAGGGWMARCLAHDDREPSLSIRDADNGKVLVRCHAGCGQRRVIAALRSRGLHSRRMRQLSPKRRICFYLNPKGSSLQHCTVRLRHPCNRQRGGPNIRAKFEIEGAIISRPQGARKIQVDQDQDEIRLPAYCSGEPKRRQLAASPERKGNGWR